VFIDFDTIFDIVNEKTLFMLFNKNSVMNGSYRLVIIEDEDEIRNGLETIIDWTSLGFCVAGSFSSGEEAIMWLEKNTADVIMTDIRLGGISGLDICHWAHRNLPSAKLVILSGYSDFSYAQQAIDCKVSKYLLKPVNIPELYGAFRAIHDEFETSISSHRFLRQAVQYSLRSLLTTLVNESADNPLLPDPSRFLTGDSFDLEGSWHLFRIRCTTVYDRLESDFNSLLASSGSYGIASVLLDKTLVVAAVRKKGSPDQGAETPADFLDHVIESVCESAGIRMTVLYSNRFGSYPEMAKYLLDSYSAKQQKTSSVSMEEIIKAVNAYDFDTIENALASLDTEALKTVGYLLLARQSQFANRPGTASDEDVYPDYPGENTISGQATAEELSESIRQIIRSFRKGVDRNASDIVDRARSFILSCGGRRVSLNEVAEHVFVSPAYLSREFKRQLGINFKAYITEASVNCAKELLAGTSIRVHEISEQLGFRDVRYFYRFFSEATGLTPTEYRNQNRKDS